MAKDIVMLYLEIHRKSTEGWSEYAHLECQNVSARRGLKKCLENALVSCVSIQDTIEQHPETNINSLQEKKVQSNRSCEPCLVRKANMPFSATYRPGGIRHFMERDEGQDSDEPSAAEFVICCGETPISVRVTDRFSDLRAAVRRQCPELATGRLSFSFNDRFLQDDATVSFAGVTAGARLTILRSEMIDVIWGSSFFRVCSDGTVAGSSPASRVASRASEAAHLS
jgi:hypothetical protein